LKIVFDELEVKPAAEIFVVVKVLETTRFVKG